MSEFKNKENSGAIFKNSKKTSEKQPDYSGTVNIAGTDKQIALWVKDGAKGKFFSVQISEVWKPKEGAAGTTVNPVVTNATKDDSGLPF